MIHFLSIVLLALSALIFHDQQSTTLRRPVNDTHFTTGDTVTALTKNIWIVFEDKSGNFWFGSNGKGVFRCNPASNSIVNFRKKHGLVNDSIRQIQEDGSGNIFFTAIHGICKFNGHTFTTLVPVESNSWKLQPGDLWFIGDQDKNGGYRYDGKVLHSVRLPFTALETTFHRRYPGLSYSPYGLYTIYRDQKGRLWFNTYNLGVCCYNGKTLSWIQEDDLAKLDDGPSFGIRSVVEDGDGAFWFSNTEYRYTIIEKDGKITYKKQDGIKALGVHNGRELFNYMSAVSDTAGNIWMVSYNAGAWCYRPGSKHTDHYLVKNNETIVTFYSIFRDRKGTLWLSSPDHGAFYFNGKDIVPFRTREP